MMGKVTLEWKNSSRSKRAVVRHELESRTTRLESLGIPYGIRNLALESGIFGSIEVRLFQETSGYFNSARLRSVSGPVLPELFFEPIILNVTSKCLG